MSLGDTGLPAGDVGRFELIHCCKCGVVHWPCTHQSFNRGGSFVLGLTVRTIHAPSVVRRLHGCLHTGCDVPGSSRTYMHVTIGACRYSTYKLVFGEFEDDVVFPLQERGYLSAKRLALTAARHAYVHSSVNLTRQCRFFLSVWRRSDFWLLHLCLHSWSRHSLRAWRR